MSIPSQLRRFKLTGICPSARGLAVSELMSEYPANVWLAVAADAKTAEALAEDAAFFHQAAGGAGQVESLFLPESMPDGGDMRAAFAAAADRTSVLSRLRAAGTQPEGKTLLVVTTPAALCQPVPAASAFAASEFIVSCGQAQSFAGLVERLQQLDYDSEAVCEEPGQYAVRGGIIDIYPIAAQQPYRFDFFGDMIEGIRAFDPITQRSGEHIERVTITASPRVPLAPALSGLADYLPPSAHLACIEPAILDAAKTPDGADGTGCAFLAPFFARCAAVFGVGELDEASSIFDGEGVGLRSWETASLAQYRDYPSDELIGNARLQCEEEERARFLRQVAAWQDGGDKVLFVLARDPEIQRTKEILKGIPGLRKLRPRYLQGTLDEGFRVVFPEGSRAKPSSSDGLPPGTAGLVVVTETEIFGRQRPRQPSRRRVSGQSHPVDRSLDFSELVEGDFVVHLQHGVAHYRGLAKVETRDGTRDAISLEFDEGVILHVPLTEAHLLGRYVGLSKARPQLGRIGSSRWGKIRQAAERATLDLAAELLRIHAAREAQPGHACTADNAWQKEFEASFPFVETPDQMRAIEETKTDMERPRPMDRLICGDVGFGKTEVAIRAAFKTVQDGKQVVVLVPTTVLAQQHLATFRERMACYPVVVEMLSRFRSPREQKAILAATAAMQVDILIGTHRLLGKDVAFKDLGLVIVDEEQRFGVRHKEALKRLRLSVDVLSLSATPIPRTLYMALTGARDLSVIETPPRDRHPIQTIVKTYEEKIVVDAIRYEIGRGGQAFYLHNRVATIEHVAARLRELLPGLRIGVGHGQMPEGELERVMTEFVAGKYHVLVCTTIIESGLDIPNCNTLIIEGADRFGLSQLYQLRGRVGRFKHQAYAYLLLHRHTHLIDVARQRLAALRQHNQLGAGFRIAMRDLELRGSGNLLGAEQSGHIAGVGFELYCQLLRQSVARLKGEKLAAGIRASVKLDFVFVGEGTPAAPVERRGYADGYTAVRKAEDAAAGAIPVSLIQARIPNSYLPEARLRIDCYRQLAMANTLTGLRQIEHDLRDRFGKFDEETKALLLVTEIRIRAEQKSISSVETDGNRLRLLRASGRRDDWVLLGSRFPRLTAPRPLLRLREIVTFLNNLP